MAQEETFHEENEKRRQKTRWLKEREPAEQADLPSGTINQLSYATSSEQLRGAEGSKSKAPVFS